MNKSIGIYVHIPFCIQKCRYCDFCSIEKSSEALRSNYVSALCAELEREAIKAQGRTVDTVFFGGGTPSLLSCDEIHKILSALHKHYSVDGDAEITLEMNPATAEKEKLKRFRQLGINRLSIGVQSSDARELSCLGRVHSYSDFLTTFQDAREARFDNINADVMYGIPHQSIDSFKKTLTSLISLSPEHISAYSLKIEEGTPFYTVRDTLLLPSEEEEYEMYCLCHDMLSSAGYTHYEISNYAKDEKHSRHNLKYWHGEEYLGFGVAAYSYFDAKRYGNTDSISEYIEKNGRCEHIDIDTLTPSDIESEYIMLRLRLREGIDDTDFLLRFGVRFSEKYARQIDKFLHTEYMKCENGRYFLTDEGMYVSNSILIEFI